MPRKRKRKVYFVQNPEGALILTTAAENRTEAIRRWGFDWRSRLKGTKLVCFDERE